MQQELFNHFCCCIFFFHIICEHPGQRIGKMVAEHIRIVSLRLACILTEHITVIVRWQVLNNLQYILRIRYSLCFQTILPISPCTSHGFVSLSHPHPCLIIPHSAPYLHSVHNRFLCLASVLLCHLLLMSRFLFLNSFLLMIRVYLCSFHVFSSFLLKYSALVSTSISVSTLLTQQMPVLMNHC